LLKEDDQYSIGSDEGIDVAVVKLQGGGNLITKIAGEILEIIHIL
jgi:hypothetical protein